MLDNTVAALISGMQRGVCDCVWSVLKPAMHRLMQRSHDCIYHDMSMCQRGLLFAALRREAQHGFERVDN